MNFQIKILYQIGLLYEQFVNPFADGAHVNYRFLLCVVVLTNKLHCKLQISPSRPTKFAEVSNCSPCGNIGPGDTSRDGFRIPETITTALNGVYPAGSTPLRVTDQGISTSRPPRDNVIQTFHWLVSYARSGRDSRSLFIPFFRGFGK